MTEARVLKSVLALWTIMAVMASGYVCALDLSPLENKWTSLQNPIGKLKKIVMLYLSVGN